MPVDGVALLNGELPKDVELPRVCINADFTVVGWKPGEGLQDVGKGTSLESAQAIARLYSGGPHYVDFTGKVRLTYSGGPARKK